MSPSTNGFPATSPKVVGAAMGVPPPNVPTAGGPAKGVMLRNAAFKAALIAVEVVVSGYKFVITVPLIVGDLPPQLAALNRTEINVHELAVRGILEKDKTKMFQAILLDPLTGAVLTIDETRRVVDEMFKAGAKYLKGYK